MLIMGCCTVFGVAATIGELVTNNDTEPTPRNGETSGDSSPYFTKNNKLLNCDYLEDIGAVFPPSVNFYLADNYIPRCGTIATIP